MVYKCIGVVPAIQDCFFKNFAYWPSIQYFYSSSLNIQCKYNSIYDEVIPMGGINMQDTVNTGNI